LTAAGYPYFIGVFETVAALGSYPTFALFCSAFLVIAMLASWGVSFFLLLFFYIFSSIMAAAVSLNRSVRTVFRKASHLETVRPPRRGRRGV